MPEQLNIANPSALTEGLNKAMRRSRNDPRVASWMKKKARAWLLRRDDNGTPIRHDEVNGFQILPGSGLDEELPDWAQKAKEEGRPLHYFSMSTSADAMLRHIDDFFADLLDYEADTTGPRSAVAKRFLDNLGHRDVKDAHDQAEQFYIDLADSAPKAASRSRNDIFAVALEDGPAVEYKVSGNLAWRQVTPRGLKTVAVTLTNCLGGSHYAIEVKTGRAEIWCLVNDLPEEEFDRERDILAAAKIRCHDRTLAEFNGPKNKAAIEHLEAMEEFAAAHTFDASAEIKRNAKGTLTKDHFKRNHESYAERSGVAFVVERMGTGIDKLMMEGVRRHDFGLAHEVHGRMKIDRLGSICIGKDKTVVIEMAKNVLSEALMNSTHEAVLVEGLENVLEGTQVIGVTKPYDGWFDAHGRDRTIVDAFDQKQEPVRDVAADLLFDEDFNLKPWTRDIVFSDNTDDAVLRVSSAGVTQIYDLNTEKSLVMLGTERICKAAQEAAKHGETSGRPISRQAWKNILKDIPPAETQERPTWGSLTKEMFAGLCQLDHSKDLVTPKLTLGQTTYHPHKIDFVLPGLDLRTTLFPKEMRDIYIEGVACPVFETEHGLRIEKAPLGNGHLYQAVSDDERLDLLALTEHGHLEFARIQSTLMERLSLADLRQLSEELLRSNAKIETPTGRTPFIEELFRERTGAPTVLNNVGSDQHPIIKLDKPNRLVGITLGADGSIENGSPAWIAMPKPRGEVALRHITPSGLEHLRRSAQDKRWTITFSPEGTAFSEIQDAGWNVAKGVLMRLSNSQIERLESEHFKIERQIVSGTEDRVFELKAKTDPNDGPRYEVPHISFGADPRFPGTPRLVLEASIPADKFPEAISLVAQAFNEMKLKPGKTTCQFFGLEEDENGNLRHDGHDFLQHYEIADGYILHRNPQAVSEDTFRANHIPLETWCLTREGNLATVAQYFIKNENLNLTKTATPEILRAAAEMLEAFQEDRAFDRPLFAAPAPKNG